MQGVLAVFSETLMEWFSIRAGYQNPLKSFKKTHPIVLSKNHKQIPKLVRLMGNGMFTQSQSISHKILIIIGTMENSSNDTRETWKRPF